MRNAAMASLLLASFGMLVGGHVQDAQRITAPPNRQHRNRTPEELAKMSAQDAERVRWNEAVEQKKLERKQRRAMAARPGGQG